MADTGKTPGPEAVDSDVSFDPAVEWFRKRIGMTQKQVDQMGVDARRKVFYVTGLSDLEAVHAVQDSLAKALERGDTFEDWKAQVQEKGLFGKEFNRRRLETIFRTNMQNAFMAGRYQELTNPAVMRRRPYWRFSAVRDGRTTPVCASAHGTILKADHPWWKTHIPPLHFNCRSTIVPMTEAAAQEAGITEHPTDLSSALGFGNPPYGVPAAARDMPTEKELEQVRKASDAVQAAVEERNTASEASRKAHRAATAARKDLQRKEKELLKATDEERPEREAAVQKAKEVSKARDSEDKKAAEELERKQKAAEKASRKGQVTAWRLVKERIARLDDGVASDAAKLLEEMLPYVEYLDEVENFDGALVGILTPDGRMVYVRQGDTFRDKAKRLIEEEAKTRSSPWEKTSKYGVYKVKDVATGVKEKTFEILRKESIPEGVLPDIRKGAPKSERVKIKPPVGSRHCIPLKSQIISKYENTVYRKQLQKDIQSDINKIIFGDGKPVKIITQSESGTSLEEYGFLVEHEGTSRLYGIEKKGADWRAYPVAGDDMLALSYGEYRYVVDLTAKQIETKFPDAGNIEKVKLALAWTEQERTK